MKRLRLFVTASLLAVSACAVNGPDRLTLSPVEFDTLPGWKADHLGSMIPIFVRNCARLAHMPPTQALGGEGEAARLGGTAGEWMPACSRAQRLRIHGDTAARRFFEHEFQAYGVADNFRPDPLFTGYYEPELVGDLAPGKACATPLFATPPDLMQTMLPPARPGQPERHVFGRLVGSRVQPYDSRTIIEDGALDGRGLELAWLSDPVALYFLQIQGSGRVILPDGRILRVGYAAQNGQPFVDIGRLLLARGELNSRQASMQDVRTWLYEHPVESRAVMDANPSYVFFRSVPDLRPDEGPLGALGLPLTPRRSIAVDARFIPLGAPVWVDTRDPPEGRPLRRLMLAQDVGGAIRGPARGDLFFGWGAEAERQAGGMWGLGGEYLLLPRGDASVEIAADKLAPRQIVFRPPLSHGRRLAR